jgi:hypothetical protein
MSREPGCAYFHVLHGRGKGETLGRGGRRSRLPSSNSKCWENGKGQRRGGEERRAVTAAAGWRGAEAADQ